MRNFEHIVFSSSQDQGGVEQHNDVSNQPQNEVVVTTINSAEQQIPKAQKDLETATKDLEQLLKVGWNIIGWMQVNYLAEDATIPVYICIISNGSQRRTMVTQTEPAEVSEFKMMSWSDQQWSVTATELATADTTQGHECKIEDYRADSLERQPLDKVVFTNPDTKLTFELSSLEFFSSLSSIRQLPTKSDVNLYPTVIPLVSSGTLKGVIYCDSEFGSQARHEAEKDFRSQDYAYFHVMRLIRRIVDTDSDLLKDQQLQSEYPQLFLSDEAFITSLMEPIKTTEKPYIFDISLEALLIFLIQYIRTFSTNNSQKSEEVVPLKPLDEIRSMATKFSTLLTERTSGKKVRKPEVSSKKEVAIPAEPKEPKPEKVVIEKKISETLISELQLCGVSADKVKIEIRQRKQDYYQPGVLDVATLRLHCTVKHRRKNENIRRFLASNGDFETGKEFKNGQAKFTLPDLSNPDWLEKAKIDELTIDSVTVIYTVENPTLEHAVLVRGGTKDLVVEGGGGTKVELSLTGKTENVKLEAVKTAVLNGGVITDLLLSGSLSADLIAIINSSCTNIEANNAERVEIGSEVQKLKAHRVKSLRAVGGLKELDAENCHLSVLFLSSFANNVTNRTLTTCIGTIRVLQQYPDVFNSFNRRKTEELQIEYLAY